MNHNDERDYAEEAANQALLEDEDYDDPKSMTWDEAYEMFDEFINETTGVIIIQGLDYSPSRLMKHADPNGYIGCFVDWADSMGIETDHLIGPDNDPRDW